MNNKESNIIGSKSGWWIVFVNMLRGVILIAILVHTTYGQERNGVLKAKNLTDWYFQKAVERYNASEFKTAIFYCDSAFRRDNKKGDAIRLKGDCEFELGRYQDALSSYSISAKIKGDDALSYKGRAQAFRFLDKCESAVEDYDKSIALSPNDVDSYFGRGCCLHRLEQYQRCIPDLTYVLAKKPKTYVCYYLRGESFLKMDRYGDALNDLRKYIAVDGEIKHSYYYRGVSYTLLSVENKLYADSAILDLKWYLRTYENDFDTYRFLGIAYGVKGDTANARIMYHKAKNIRSDNSDLYYNWGNTEFLAGNSELASELYDQALNLRTNGSAGLYYHNGMAKSALRDTTGALLNYSRAIAIDSSNLDFYQKRLEITLKSSRYDSLTLHDFTRLIKINLKGNTDSIVVSQLYSSRANIYMRQKRYTETRNDLNAGVLFGPHHAYAYLMRAFIFMNLPEPGIKQVLDDIDKAIILNDKRWDSYILKAIALEMFQEPKNKSELCQLVSKAFKLGCPSSNVLRDYFCGASDKHTQDGLFAFLIKPEP